MPEDYGDLPKSYTEAKAIGALYYFTNQPCKRGHIACKLTSNRTCLVCIEESMDQTKFIERVRNYNKQESVKKRKLTHAQKPESRVKQKEYGERPENRQRRNTRKKERYANDLEYRKHQRDRYLWFKYRLTLDSFNIKLSEQNNKCAICSLEFNEKLEPRVDHDHATDAVRDLLCDPCNVALGGFKDNPQILQSAIRYLRRHSPIHNNL